MSEVQFFQTRLGQQYFGNTLPELVRQLTRLNEMLALGVELFERQIPSNGDPCKCRNSGKSAPKTS